MNITGKLPLKASFCCHFLSLSYERYTIGVKRPPILILVASFYLHNAFCLSGK